MAGSVAPAILYNTAALRSVLPFKLALLIRVHPALVGFDNPPIPFCAMVIMSISPLITPAGLATVSVALFEFAVLVPRSPMAACTFIVAKTQNRKAISTRLSRVEGVFIILFLIKNETWGFILSDL